MSEYKPQVGDRVRRTFDSGTVIEGVICEIGSNEAAYDQEFRNVLYDKNFSEQTELLHRPRELKREPFTIYKDPPTFSFVVRRAQEGLAWPWVDDCGESYSDKEVENMVSREGWVLHEG